MVELLLGKGYAVVGIDDLSTGKIENMNAIRNNITFFEGSLCDPQIVQSSSSAVYGNGDTLPAREDMRPDALSPYAAVKLSQEYYGKAFRSSLDVVSLRYFNVFGPKQDPASEYATVIPKFITLMLEGKQPVIFGDGEQTRLRTPRGSEA